MDVTNLRILRGTVVLDCLDGPSVVTKLLVSERGRRERVREGRVAMEAGVRVRGRPRKPCRCRTGQLSRLETAGWWLLPQSFQKDHSTARF